MVYFSITQYTELARVFGAKSESKMDGRKRKRCRAVEQGMESSLRGREQQMKVLRTFLSSHLKNRRPGSLFITGPPGSGKSATVDAVLSEKVSYVNLLQLHYKLFGIFSNSGYIAMIKQSLIV